MHKRLLIIQFSIALIILAMTGLPVFGATTGPLIQVSGVSPFNPDCGDFPGIFNGTNFVDSEVEPWVAVNPANLDNIVAFFQQSSAADPADGFFRRVTP